MKGRKTVVRGIRATPEFWANVDRVAKRDLLTRNQFILQVLQKHCDYEDFLLSKNRKTTL